MNNNKNSNISLAVIIPTWRRAAQLVMLLDSLERQIRLPDEIIIACRYDDEESLNTVRKWAESSPLGRIHKIVKVYEEGHLPPIIAAIKECKSDIVCQIDDDAIPREDWLLRLEEDFQDPHLGGIGGKVINHIKEKKDYLFDRPEIEIPGKMSWFGRSGKCHLFAKSHGNLFEADCFIGCNMAFRKNALKDAIDMNLNGGSAISYETDIALNVRKKGFYLLYDPKVIVDHFPLPRLIEAKRGWNSKECFWYAHNLTYICLKHLHWYGKIGFLVYFFIGGSWGCPGLITYTLRLISGRPASWNEQFIPSLRGRLAGIRSYYKCGKKPKIEKKKWSSLKNGCQLLSLFL